MNKNNYIGGAFSLFDTEPFIQENEGDYNRYFPEKLNSSNRILFECGIDALASIIAELWELDGVKAVYFPIHYCQESITRLGQKLPSLLIKRYSNLDEFLNQQETNIILWNHFNKHIDVPSELLGGNIILIEDFVQAPLDMRKAKAKYCFNSLRKFCNIEVAVCYCKKKDLQSDFKNSKYYLQKKKAELSKYYFQKTMNSVLENMYLEEFKIAEKELECTDVFFANILEKIKFHHTNFSDILSIRQSNFSFIKYEILNTNFLEIVEGDYMYMMLKLKNRDGLRKLLAQNKIFTSIHWLDSADTDKANSYLTLPVDQRYNKNEMKRLTEILKTFHAN